MTNQFDITFLGTAGTAPTPDRSLPATVVRYNKYIFLVDCGEGTTRQWLTAKLPFRNIIILLTHSHLDHVGGLNGFLSHLNPIQSGDPFIVAGSAKTISRAKHFLAGVRVPDIKFINLEQEQLPLDPEIIKVVSFRVTHNGGSLGFRFITPRTRRFNHEMSNDLGLSYQDRHALFEHKAVFAKGREWNYDDLWGEEVDGTSISYIGDTRNPLANVEDVRNSDLLICEGTCLDRDAENAHINGHSTVKNVSKLAKQANVKRLILNHVNDRYFPNEIAKDIYDGGFDADENNFCVAKDFKRVLIK
jgi:ribonuclease Z